MFFNRFFKTYIDEKLITIVFWPDKILLNQSLKTKAGFWMDVAPYILLNTTYSPIEIGNKILDLLERPSYIIPTPKFNVKNKLSLRLEAVNVKSEKEFMRGAKLVLIQLRSNFLTFTPTKNNGHKGDESGFRELTELKITEDFKKDSIHLGNTVLQIKEKCIILNAI